MTTTSNWKVNVLEHFLNQTQILEKLRKLDGTVIDIIDHCSINLYFLSENCFPTETWILRYQAATLFVYSSSINQMLKYRFAILSKNQLNPNVSSVQQRVSKVTFRHLN